MGCEFIHAILPWTTTKPDLRGVTRGNYVWAFKQFPDVTDTAKERLDWFRQAMSTLVDLVPDLESVAMPARIGCGLAGGDWFDYLQEIRIFAGRYGVDVVLYDNEAKRKMSKA